MEKITYSLGKIAFIQLPSGEDKNKNESKIKLSNFAKNHNVNVLFPSAAIYCSIRRNWILTKNDGHIKWEYVR